MIVNKNTNLANLKNVYFNNLEELEDNQYLLDLENRLDELELEKPILENIYDINDDIRYGNIEIDTNHLYIYKDIGRIENLFYEDFCEYIPIKKYNDKGYLEQEFDKYLDELVKKEEILSETRNILRFNITTMSL